MRLTTFDWAIMLVVIVIGIILGLLPSRSAGKSAEAYFRSDRSMKWWLLGTSMVATTFSTDTPNLVAALTRTQGVSGNWAWWAFLLTTMTTTFFFAHLWRRSGVSTDVAFYELRYSGRAASALRIFRGLYIGVLINIIITAAVTLAAIKFGGVLLGLSPVETVLLAGGATALFSVAGGLRGVLLSDFFLFFTAMTGAFAAAWFALDHPLVGGLSGLFARPEIREAAQMIPSLSDPTALVNLLIVPLLVQWWSVWYPGAEPGGGGYVAQRMLAAKNERHAMGGMVLFAFAHYALRSWPWIIVALASMVVFPDIDSLRRAFPDVASNVIGDDMAYPAMLTFLPSGWLGLVAASLTAAYMSTAGTSLNLGSSYVVIDIYRRFLRPDAPEREYVLVGRAVSALLMVIIAVLALTLSSALQTFEILLSVGAGTGLLFMVRWYWPRINAWSEISAMAISLIVSLLIQFTSLSEFPYWARLSLAVAVTTIGWIIVTFMTPADDEATLQAFNDRVHPPGPGWARFRSSDREAEQRGQIGNAFLCTIAGSIMVYSAMFAIGKFLVSETLAGAALVFASAIAATIMVRGWRKINFENERPAPGEVGQVQVATAGNIL